MGYWIKFYTEILEDPKMALLEDHIWRRISELFLLAGKVDKDGQLPQTKEIAWVLRSVDVDGMQRDLEQIAAIGIIEKNEDGWIVVSFTKRQAASTSTERSIQARKRERQRQYSWNNCGIYKIECKANGKVYIGSSIDIDKRIKQHFYDGRSFIDHWMHQDLNDFGAKKFAVTVLENNVPENRLPERETYWIEQHKDQQLYNKELTGKQHRDRNATSAQRNVAQITDSETDTETETESEAESAPGAALAAERALDQLSPVEAGKIREIQVFRDATGRFPGRPTYGVVVSEIRTHKHTADYLHPFFVEWCSRGYRPTNLGWLTDWAACGEIPRAGPSPGKNGNGSSASDQLAKMLAEAEVENGEQS